MPNHVDRRARCRFLDLYIFTVEGKLVLSGLLGFVDQQGKVLGRSQ